MDPKKYHVNMVKLQGFFAHSLFVSYTWFGYFKQLVDAYAKYPEIYEQLENVPSILGWRSSLGRTVCFICRNLDDLDWTGYIGVRARHPWYQQVLMETMELVKNKSADEVNRHLESYYASLKFIHKDKVSRFGFLTSMDNKDIKTYADQEVFTEYTAFKGIDFHKGFVWFLLRISSEAAPPTFLDGKLTREPLPITDAATILDEIAYEFYKHEGKKVPTDYAYRAYYLSACAQFSRRKRG